MNLSRVSISSPRRKMQHSCTLSTYLIFRITNTENYKNKSRKIQKQIMVCTTTNLYRTRTCSIFEPTIGLVHNLRRQRHDVDVGHQRNQTDANWMNHRMRLDFGLKNHHQTSFDYGSQNHRQTTHREQYLRE